MIETDEKKDNKQNPSAKSRFFKLVFVFLRAQVAAFIGVLFDYSLMITLTEIVGVYYVISIAAGAMLGAIVNYIINRYWAFNARKESKLKQIPKFFTVVVGSIILKAGGTYILTETLHLDYKLSRLAVDAVVAYGFIFVLQKTWVFKE